MAASEAAERMRVVVTSVPPTPGLRLSASDFVRTPDGRIYLSHGTSGPVIKIGRDGKSTVVPVQCDTLARDGRGRVFCSVYSGVLEIMPDDRVALLAGTNVEPAQRRNLIDQPDVDGKGAEARFHPINKMTADAAGNVYVESGGLPVVGVRKIRPNGQTSTVFASKQVALGSNNWGWRNFAADDHGNLYFGANGAVIKVDASGAIGILAGRHAAGPGSHIGEAGIDLRFSDTHDLRVDARGNVYAFVAGGKILKVTPDGKVTTALQSGCPTVNWVQAEAMGCTAGLVDGGLEKQFIGLDGFDVDEDGDIYYIDQSANAIRKATPDGRLSTIVRGPFPKRP